MNIRMWIGLARSALVLFTILTIMHVLSWFVHNPLIMWSAGMVMIAGILGLFILSDWKS